MKKILPVLILISLSCKTTEEQSPGTSVEKLDKMRLEVQISEDSVEEWLSALEFIESTRGTAYLPFLVDLITEEKYLSVRQEALRVMGQFPSESIKAVERGILGDNFNKSLVLLQAVKQWDKDVYYSYMQLLFARGDSDTRKKYAEYYGQKDGSFFRLKEIYRESEGPGREMVFTAASYMDTNEVRQWLMSVILVGKEGDALPALFSLSRHGEKGFSLLAENLLKMNERIQPICVDLLTFNRVVEAYPQFLILLQKQRGVLQDKILTHFARLDDSVTPYLIEGVKISTGEIRLELLKLLGKYTPTEELKELVLLLESDEAETVSLVTDLLFRAGREDLLTEKLENSDNVLLIFESCIRNRYPFLIENRLLQNKTLMYLLSEMDYFDSLDYLRGIRSDERFIKDYAQVFVIFKAVERINAIVLGGYEDLDYYFLLKDEVGLTDEVSSLFYSYMEQWVQTGELHFLDKADELKKNRSSEALSARKELSLYYDTLSEESRELLRVVDSSERKIIASYRKLSFRMKHFADRLLTDGDLEHLIGD